MKAIIYLLVAAVFWGINFHFAKIMLSEVRFIEAAAWRYIFGVLPLFFLAYKQLPSWTAIRENLKGILLIGIVCLFGFNIFFFIGLKYSSAINGSLIISTAPMLTILFSSSMLKTPLERKHIIGTVISLFGVLYLILKGNLLHFTQLNFSISDILLLVASTLFALQNVWIKKYGAAISNINFTLLTNFLCLLSFLIVLPFVGMEEVSTYSISFWFSAIGIGFFGTAVAYYFWNEGIKISSANQAGIMLNVVPLSTAIFSIILGEELFMYHLISGLLILVGVIVIRRQ
ncbi:MAG: DMT family transporter [Bacteroidia bacterium]|nr:DMT family transporter [Bacteroidia bacterium]